MREWICLLTEAVDCMVCECGMRMDGIYFLNLRCRNIYNDACFHNYLHLDPRLCEITPSSTQTLVQETRSKTSTRQLNLVKSIMIF